MTDPVCKGFPFRRTESINLEALVGSDRFEISDEQAETTPPQKMHTSGHRKRKIDGHNEAPRSTFQKTNTTNFLQCLLAGSLEKKSSDEDADGAATPPLPSYELDWRESLQERMELAFRGIVTPLKVASRSAGLIVSPGAQFVQALFAAGMRAHLLNDSKAELSKWMGLRMEGVEQIYGEDLRQAYTNGAFALERQVDLYFSQEELETLLEAKAAFPLILEVVKRNINERSLQEIYGKTEVGKRAPILRQICDSMANREEMMQQIDLQKRTLDRLIRFTEALHVVKRMIELEMAQSASKLRQISNQRGSLQIL